MGPILNHKCTVLLYSFFTATVKPSPIGNKVLSSNEQSTTFLLNLAKASLIFPHLRTGNSITGKSVSSATSNPPGLSSLTHSSNSPEYN